MSKEDVTNSMEVIFTHYHAYTPKTIVIEWEINEEEKWRRSPSAIHLRTNTNRIN